MNKIFITIKKELRSIFRDKKTLATIFIYPLMIPLMVILYGELYQNIESKDTTYNVGINYELNEVEDSILSSLNLEVTKLDDVKDLEKEYNDNKIDAYITKENNNYTIYANTSNTSGMAISSLIDTYFENYNKYLTDAYLVSQNVDLDKAYNHFNVEYKQLNENNYVVTLLLSISITYIILSICIATANMATVATATEKENGTLETILTFPIKKTELIIGKYISSVIVGFIAAIASLIFMILSMVIGTKHYEIYKDLDLLFNIKTITLSILIVLAASIFIAGIAYLLTAKAKNFKEAQSKTSLITLLGTVPMFITLMDVEISKYYYLIPVCNFEQILNDLFTNSINIEYIFIAIISTIVYTIIVVTYVIKSYNSESILFKD